MLRYLAIYLSVAALTGAGASDSHKVFRVTPESQEQLKVLNDLENEGYDYWQHPSALNKSADLLVPSEKIEEFTKRMDANNIKFVTFIEEVEALFEKERGIRPRAGTFGWTTYHNLEEIYKWLDSLATRYPDKVKAVVGGRTYEGRQIKGVKVSFGDGNPGVFIEGGIHAREWISPATVTYFLNQLLVSTDSAVRQLAESHDWYIFPVFNPDGYAYTHQYPTNANFRLWRKSRSPNTDVNPFACYGTDLNRNWDVQWRTVGTSKNPCSEAYAGRQAFSEVETKTMSQYIKSISGKLTAYIAFHSYSEVLMFPYGHTKAHLDNYDQQYTIGRKAIQALSKRYGTAYKVGNIGEVIGLASGGSVDWVKSALKLPMVFVYELRDKGKHGFVLPANQIIPNCLEVMDSLVALFAEGKKYGYK